MTRLRPSDMELMQHADGELDAVRAAEVDAWLAGSQEGRAIVASFEEIGSVLRNHVHRPADTSPADGIASEVMARIDAEPRSAKRVVPLRPQPSARMEFGFAMGGLALAATVALVIWHFAGTNTNPHASGHPSASNVDPTPEFVVASAAIAPADLEDQEPGVSVDAIEFGAHTGTIFYVPSDTGTTTVVWLTDDDTGETK